MFCHDECSFFVVPEHFLLSFRTHARNPVWMLHFAYAPFSMTSVVSFRALFFVIPSESEESSMDASLRLRSVQHDKRGVIPSTFLSFRAKRGIHCGFFIQMQKFFQMKVQFR